MKKIFLLILSLIFFFTFAQKLAFAQFRTDSNTVTTKIGNPVTISSGLGAVATEIGTVVGSACGGSLHRSNLSCLEGVSLQNIPNATAALAQLTKSAHDNLCDDAHPEKGYCLQCVGFVQAAVASTYGQTLDNGGNAKDFAIKVPNGYQFIPASGGTPQEGDIIIKTGGQYGHIAIVTKIYNASKIQVAEGNWNVNGEIGPPQNVDLSLWAGWLRKQ